MVQILLVHIFADLTLSPVKSNEKGQVDIEALRSLVDSDVAAIMMTNPNTLGIFEENVLEISKIMHENWFVALL